MLTQDLIVHPVARYGVPFAGYLDIDAINASTLVEMATSPKHYRYAIDHPREDSAALRLGRAVHTMLLQPELFTAEYALSPFDSFRTNESKAWRLATEAAGQTILTPEQLRQAKDITDAVHRAPEALRYLSGGMAEVTLEWTDGPTGLRCKGRADYIGKALVDLKTSRAIVPRQFERQAADLNYHMKLSWYRDAIEAITGKQLPAVLVVVETDPPHDVAVYEIPADVLEAGRKKYASLLDRVAECKRSGSWPGVTNGQVLRLHLPAWASE